MVHNPYIPTYSQKTGEYMDVKSYPVLSEELSISKVTTERGEDMLIYNTRTRVKAYPNSSTFEFAKRCRGDRSFEAIISEFSRLSGEPPEKIQKTLSPLVEKMEEKQMISFRSSPLKNPRPEPYEARLFKRLPSVMVEVTRRCNARCKHCYNDSGTKRNNELTFEEIKKLLDELARMGVVNVVLTGGEPLLHPHLFSIIKHIRSKPMSLMLFTNGTLVTEETVRTLKDLGIISVAVSLDGATPETNDSFRGVPGGFEKTVKAIEILKKAGIPLRINVCVHKGIISEFADLLNLFEKWKIDEHSVWPVSYTGRNEKEDFLVTPEEYKKILAHLRQYEESRGIKKEIPYNPQQINCGIGMGSLTIRSDGSVTPCPSFPDEIILGNIRKDSVTKIWNDSPFLRKMRRFDASENDQCRGCSFIKACGGGCMADHYRRTGELGCYNPLECAYYDVYRDYELVEAKRTSRLSVEIR